MEDFKKIYKFDLDNENDKKEFYSILRGSNVSWKSLSDGSEILSQDSEGVMKMRYFKNLGNDQIYTLTYHILAGESEEDVLYGEAEYLFYLELEEKETNTDLEHVSNEINKVIHGIKIENTIPMISLNSLYELMRDKGFNSSGGFEEDGMQIFYSQGDLNLQFSYDIFEDCDIKVERF